MGRKSCAKEDFEEVGSLVKTSVRLSLVLSFAFVLAAFFLAGCQSNQHTLKIAATAVPHADLLNFIRPDLEEKGIHLKIIEVDDYSLPNRLLSEGQVDANFFQHLPYLEEQKKRFGFKLVPLASVHLEPLGIYSEKITSLDSLKEGSHVAIPSDPTNEARALDLLADAGLIHLKEGVGIDQATIYDIERNPKNLKFIEVDAPFLPRTLPDVELAVIPANFALQAGLNPLKQALVLESTDSPYANIIVVRSGEENREDFQLLKNALQSDKFRTYILNKYKGAVIPVEPSKN